MADQDAHQHHRDHADDVEPESDMQFGPQQRGQCLQPGHPVRPFRRRRWPVPIVLRGVDRPDGIQQDGGNQQADHAKNTDVARHQGDRPLQQEQDEGGDGGQARKLTDAETGHPKEKDVDQPAQKGSVQHHDQQGRNADKQTREVAMSSRVLNVRQVVKRIPENSFRPTLFGTNRGQTEGVHEGSIGQTAQIR